MQRSPWERLAAPFPPAALTWRVQEIGSDGRTARVRPQLDPAAVVARLDETLGAAGWSFTLAPMGADAAVCTLTVDGVSKAGVARDADPVRAGDDALVRAAEHFGLRPPADPAPAYWVDYDPESQAILHTPELVPSSLPDGVRDTAAATDDGTIKPEAQQMIDRLLDRLRQDGLGLEAAKLIVRYEGYGKDPDTARELYTRLRSLLVDREPVR